MHKICILSQSAENIKMIKLHQIPDSNEPAYLTCARKTMASMPAINRNSAMMQSTMKY